MKTIEAPHHASSPGVPDMKQAAQYLEALTGSPDTPVTWCLLQERPGKSKSPVSLYGTLSQHQARLSALNSAGCGVFIAVNAIKPAQRRIRDNVTALRALFVDSDGGALRRPGLPPSFYVESARGQHAYWTLVEEEPLAMFEAAQKQIAAFYGSDPTVCDLPRLMRVPGFLHQKGQPFLVRFVPGGSERRTVGDVLKAHPVSADQMRTLKRANTTKVVANASAEAAAGVSGSMASADFPLIQLRKSRAEAYLRHVSPAVEGEGGDAQTFKTACVVVRDFAVDNFDDAMGVLQEWNSRCSPPWDESDLAQKVRSALRNGQGSYGSKLQDQRARHAPAAPVANADEELMPADVGATQHEERHGHAAAVAPEEPTRPVGPVEAEGVVVPVEAATNVAMAGLEGFSGNEDQPLSLHLVELMAREPTSILAPEVIAKLEALKRKDESEYQRCLFEVKAARVGLVNDLKRAVARCAQQRMQEKAKAREQQTVYVRDALPVAKELVGADHQVPFNYVLDWKGVTLLVETKREDEGIKEVPVCDRPVIITAALDKTDGSGTLLELAFRTRDTKSWLRVVAPRDVVMTPRLLNGLALHRFPVYGGNAAVLSEYLLRYETVNERTIVRKKAAVQMGWQGDDGELGFLLGKQHIAPAGYDGAAVEFAADSDGDAQLAGSFRKGGTPDAWFGLLDTIAQYPRVHLGVLASLAAPLLQLLRLDNFFVDYSGETSGGKTTTLQIAASVWGPPSDPRYALMRSWNTTVAGMERAASMMSGLPLFVDESNEAQTPLERQALAKMIYQLANGRGRTRAMRTFGSQPLRRWSTVVLSSGEHPIVNATQDAGTRARILSLQDSPFGGVTEATTKDVERLKHAVTHNYGHAGAMFTEWVVAHKGEAPRWIERHRQLANSYQGDPQVPKAVAQRLGRHLALLDLVGELLAEAFDLLTYESPVRACLGAVMDSAQDADRPKDALQDVVSAVHATTARLYGEANYDPAMGVIGRRGADCHGERCLAVTALFVREVLTKLGHNPHRVTRSWLTRGYLMPGQDGKASRVVRLAAPVRCFCIRESAITDLMK